MAYELVVTEHADELLDHILRYFIYQLKNKQVAVHLLDEIQNIYDRLEDNPLQFPFSRDTYLANKEYHEAVVGQMNYTQLLGYFDYYVSSSVAGYRKPNCRGLHMISEKFDIPITELIFIGDEEKDRKTALNANCKFIWIQRTNKNEDSIGNLCELLDILE